MSAGTQRGGAGRDVLKAAALRAGGSAVPMALPSAVRALHATASRMGAPRSVPRGAAPPLPADGKGGTRPVPPPVPPRGAAPVVDFGDPQEAFRSKSSAELLRGLLVLGLCAVGPLVEHNREVSARNRGRGRGG